MGEKMDEDISVWILEFLLRQSSVDDSIIKLTLSNLPLPPDTSIPLRLKQSLLLRTIHSEVDDASISEPFLDHLESLQAIDALLGLPTPASLKEAYSAVALDCTLRFLHIGAAGKAKYSAAVQRIWRGRIRDLEGKCQLVTAELRSWSARLEAAIIHEEERENLMKIDGRAEGFKSLRAYLDEAYLKMGPSFLEVAASSAAAGQAAPLPPPSREADTAAAKGKNSEASEVRDSAANDAAGPSAGAPRNAHGSRTANSQNERQKVAVPSRKPNQGMRRRGGGGIKIVDTGESGGGTPDVGSDSLPTPMVDGVLDALKSSSLELKAAVQDPLPEAMRVAASLVPDAATTTPNPDSLPQDHVAAASSPDPLPQDHVAAAPNPDPLPRDHVAAPEKLGDQQAQPCASQYVLPRRSLMERKSCAQTYQWDDSLEETSDQMDRPRLHSPKRDAVSPLRVDNPQKLTKRRRRKFWSLQEEEALREGVNKFGVGNWKLICNGYRDVLEERTEVDLKDKWRNMTR